MAGLWNLILDALTEGEATPDQVQMIASHGLYANRERPADSAIIRRIIRRRAQKGNQILDFGPLRLLQANLCQAVRSARYSKASSF